MKHLTKTLAVVSLLLPMSAQPLGIGDIQLHSALNQKLDAEIHLHLAAGENPADVSVRLAPPEKFDQAGVPWNYVLSKIKFQPVVQPNGSVIVKVTSREPLTEPFLDFLLEVTWPQGSQFREFTVLVDPPAEYHAPAIPSSGIAAVPDYRNEQLDDYASEKPVRKARASRPRVKQAQAAAAGITPQTPGSGEYGPTQTSDTLWKIADQLSSERNVPTKQMLAALFQANPDAFNHGNMDSLKTGVVLKIPETDAIVQAYGKTGAKPVRKPAATAEQTASANTKALELVAPTDAKITDKTDLNSPVKAGPETAGDGRASAGGGNTDGKDLELQSRIEKLEQQLNMMQQLLALKDQQLATLQSNGKEPVKSATETVPSPPTEQPAAASATPAAPQAPVTPPATPTPPVAEQPAVAPPPAPAEIKPAPVPAEPPKPVKPAVVSPPPPVEEDFFSSDSYTFTIGGLSAGMIGLLGWLLWRKRKIESMTNTESMFASASQIKMPDADSSLAVPVMDINSTGAYDVGTVGESSFISDFTPSDFEAFDTDQNDIDPMSEADVYLAYGRYQQAEDLIRHAIKDQPHKDDYKLKLLEIFYANENRERFAAYAQELANAGKNNDAAFWHKVSEMAKEIIPESALFGGTEKVAVTKTAAPVATESAAAEPFTLAEQEMNFSSAAHNDDLIDLDAPSLPDMALMDEINSELAELQLTLPEESDDNGLDFDLSSFSKPDPKAETKLETAAADIESIDFDLSGLDAKPAADTDKPAVSDSSLESFDFNFELDPPKSETETPAPTLDMASLESFDFPEFGDGVIEEKSLKQPIAPVSASPLSLDTPDEFDFNFDFEAPSGTAGTKSKTSDDEIDFGVSDLTDMDEFETKIDLAKAYIDMGDSDAAKTIAEEVLAKGNPEQKQAAQALLDELK